MTQIDYLVISAHPDDAEFGVAGTVALKCRNGQAAVYVVCTDGEKGTGDRSMDPGQLAVIRRKEQQAAAGILGVENVVFLGYPDQGLEDTAAFRKDIVRQIRRYRPHTVITSDPYKKYIWHRDHRIVGQVALDAVYPYARDHLAYPDLLDEELEPHKVKEIWFWGSEDVNHRVDITGSFDLKLKALQCHHSQIRELEVGDPEKMLRTWCRKMAQGESFDLAEAFHRVVI